MKEIVFVARLHKLSESRLAFYVPINAGEYYEQLTDGSFKVTIEWKPNFKIKDATIRFGKYKDRLRGMIPRVGNFQALEAGMLVLLRLVVGE